MNNKIKQIAKSNVLHFLINKYAVFLLQFIKSLYIAVVLGPFYFGIWGFISLIQQYLSYTNLGVQFSLNIFLSLEDKDSGNASKYLSSSLIITFLISIILLFIYSFIVFLNINLFPKYEYSDYFLFTIIIAILIHYNQIFINVYRSYGLLYKIAFSELFFQILSLSMVFFYSGKQLLYALLIATIVSKFISIIVFIINMPVKPSLGLDYKILKAVLKKGFYFLMYSISFYLILISSRTLISYYYDVDTMGKYSFANSLAVAVLMGLQTIGWIILPKAINKLKSDISDVEAVSLISKLRGIYLMILFFLSFVIIAIFPFLIKYLPKYVDIIPVFSFLMLAQVIITNSYGYNILTLARHKEKKLTKYGFITVFINIILSLILINIFKLEYQYVGLSVLISVFYYNYALVKYSLSLINQNNNFKTVISIIFPLKVFIPLLIIFIIVLGGLYNFVFIGTLIFIILNYKELKISFIKGLSIFTNPKLIKK